MEADVKSGVGEGLERSQAFHALLAATKPSTFGHHGLSILDETYRKARSLDTSSFSTDFSPYEAGIIDVVNQALVPVIAKSSSQRGVRAELYKLNVYSGPSGHFKAHVDTPRGDAQVGSLVVCLPCGFEGGALTVRNHGVEVTFDWATPTSTSSTTTTPTIHWATFYSDCSHEVHPVTSGHRITLTYNLYISRGTGLLSTRLGSSMDATENPLFGTLSRLLRNEVFLKDGGTLGVWCSHAYPHTSGTSFREMPACLKGSDMILHETLRALNLGFKVAPTTEIDGSAYDANDYEWNSDDYDSDGDLIGGEKGPFKETPIAAYHDRFEPADTWDHVVHYEDRFDEGPEPGKLIKGGDVKWIGEARHKELRHAYIAYGNEPSMASTYTSVAILISIPKFVDRKGIAGK